MSRPCMVCQKPSEFAEVSKPAYGFYIKCEICGQYRIRQEATMEEVLPQDQYLYSAIIRENFENGNPLWIEKLVTLKDSVAAPSSPIECIDRILRHIYQKMGTFDTLVKMNKETDFPIGYSKTPDEFQYLIEKARKLGYIETLDGLEVRLALLGWERISELHKSRPKSNQAFVAMWFDDSLVGVWKNGLEAALTQVGYKAIRIDQSEHNGKICDQIIAEIRKSSLLVADFTGQRNGVYFEAGFAMGLGIPVIWTCREDDVAKLHFDTRQYNHIVWKDASDLKNKLVARIEATVPMRPQSN